MTPILLFLSTLSFAQIQFISNNLTKITYQVSSNGIVNENQNPIWVFADAENVLITSRDLIQQKSNFPFEMTFVQPQKASYSQFGFLNSNEAISMMDSESLADRKSVV